MENPLSPRLWRARLWRRGSDLMGGIRSATKAGVHFREGRKEEINDLLRDILGDGFNFDDLLELEHG